MKMLSAVFVLGVALVGTAFAQMPAIPSAAAAKAAADSTAKKATSDVTAAKNSAQTTVKAGADKGQASAAATKTDATSKAKEAGAAVKSAIDLNTASEADLAALPGVGADNAKKIVDARPFARKDQLVSKKILTKANFDEVKELIVAKRPAKK